MAQLAEQAGIPFRTYQSIESGERWPRVENLETIARTLGVPVSKLFQDSPPPAQPHRPTPHEALEVLSELVRAGPNPTSPDAERVISALEDPMARAVILDVVKQFEREQRRQTPSKKADTA
jgi:transcriptional regulator with XRE-family HTH domain